MIRQRRGDANRLGFAVQLSLLRHPGIALAEDTQVPPEVVSWLASDLAVSPEAWAGYGTREETRQEHGREIRAYLGMSAFGIADFRQLVEHVSDGAAQTDKGLLLVESAKDFLQAKKIAIPGVRIIEKSLRTGPDAGESANLCQALRPPLGRAPETPGWVVAPPPR